MEKIEEKVKLIKQIKIAIVAFQLLIAIGLCFLVFSTWHVSEGVLMVHFGLCGLFNLFIAGKLDDLNELTKLKEDKK